MKKINDMKAFINSGKLDETLQKLYPAEQLDAQRSRYYRVAGNFETLYGDDGEVGFFSAPGRTEVGGNHTDHNHGRVLAASVNLDAIACAGKNEDNIVRVKSEGYKMDVVDLSELNVIPAERGKSVSLVRGVCAAFEHRGYKIGGFNAATASDVLSGSGLSSSAAFEVLLGTILNHLFNDGKISAVEIAQIAQYAENEYFGKPCGLMDQTASSVGSFVQIDFADPAKPVIEKLDFDFASCGHALCIVDTGGSHSDLTDEYAAVRSEMEAVAQKLGASVLRDCDREKFEKEVASLRSTVGDRAVLRAIHFYADNDRVLSQAAALNANDFETFKSLIIESGNSSYMYNQNVFTCRNTAVQPVSVALAFCEQILRGKGAWRVHGGGFAGTIQAFVPFDMRAEFKSKMESIFGSKACHVLSIRAFGGVSVCDIQ